MQQLTEGVCVGVHVCVPLKSSGNKEEPGKEFRPPSCMP